MLIRSPRDLRSFPREALETFVAENLKFLTEDEVLSILENPYANARLIGTIAQTARLTSFYSVRLRIVSHRQTPQAHAVKFVHYLYWPDLLRLSVEVTVPATTRRAIDTQLVNRVHKLSLGEKITSARRCSPALIQVLMFDRDPKVFGALLNNSRLREENLVDLVQSGEASPEQLMMIAADRRWVSRYAIRRALVLNVTTPKGTAATQLRFLSRRDLRDIYGNPNTSVYLRRCIERMSDRLISE